MSGFESSESYNTIKALREVLYYLNLELRIISERRIKKSILSPYKEKKLIKKINSLSLKIVRTKAFIEYEEKRLKIREVSKVPSKILGIGKSESQIGFWKRAIEDIALMSNYKIKVFRYLELNDELEAELYKQKNDDCLIDIMRCGLKDFSGDIFFFTDESGEYIIIRMSLDRGSWIEELLPEKETENWINLRNKRRGRDEKGRRLDGYERY